MLTLPAAAWSVAFLAANEGTQSDVDTARATLLGAVIAGVTGALATILTVLIQRFSDRRAEAFAAEQAKLDRVERQINELYGPLLLMRRQSHYLWSRLREGKPDPDWRLLNHIEDVRTDPAEFAIAQEIVRLNGVTQDLILKHPALVLGDNLPESFHKFLAHAGIVSVAMSTGKVPGNGTFIYYPSEFDQDLEIAYDALVKTRIRAGRST